MFQGRIQDFSGGLAELQNKVGDPGGPPWPPEGPGQSPGGISGPEPLEALGCSCILKGKNIFFFLSLK